MVEDKEEKKSFRVIDKRTAAEATEKKEEKVKKATKAQAKEAQKEAQVEQPPPVPEVTFSAFVYSLSTSALVHLGEIPEPITEKMDKNLPLAKQTIDILGILQEKTKGNLTQEEENLLNSFLYDLRMRYVKAMG
jgi:outer membrane biosynthesis protein TonB